MKKTSTSFRYLDEVIRDEKPYLDIHVPIVPGESIGLDNTCKAGQSLKQFFKGDEKKVRVFFRAIMISLVGMHYIWNVVQLKGFAQYRGYFSITMQIFAAIQVIKSASRSILLPGLCLIFGSAGAHQLITSGHSHLLGADHTFYEGMVITGILGFAVAVLTID